MGRMEPEAISALRRYVRILSGVDLLALATSDSRPSRAVRFHLATRSLPQPFLVREVNPRARSGDRVSRRQVYRRLREWRDAHILVVDGRESKRLPWNPRARKLAPRDLDRDPRGRPAQRLRFVDPLASQTVPRVDQLPTLAAMLRDPSAVDLLAGSLERTLQLLVKPDGRDLLRDLVAPAVLQEDRDVLLRVVEAFGPIDPQFAAQLPSAMANDYRKQLTEYLPRIASMLESHRIEPSGEDPSPDGAGPGRGEGSARHGLTSRCRAGENGLPTRPRARGSTGWRKRLG